VVDNVLDKAYHLFGADFGKGPSLDPFSELVDRDMHVGAFLKGPKRSKPHTAKVYVMGVVWSSWAGV
jgi:hypothetical protein